MHASSFLPERWQDAPIGLLAGQGGEGSYVWELINSAKLAGVDLRLISMRHETSPAVVGLFDPTKHVDVPVADLGALLKACKSLGIKGLIMAGQVTPNKLFKEVLPDMRALALLMSLKEKNAETIFGAVADEIEKIGVKVLDARCFMDNLLASEGIMVKGKEFPSKDAIAHGIKIAEAMAGADVGQSVVTRKGTTLAVEAFEGTDAMIARAGGFKTGDKIFVKTVKHQQDWRFDVPVFGLKTLRGLIDSGIGCAILKEGSVLIPQKAAVLELAKKAKITLMGY